MLKTILTLIKQGFLYPVHMWKGYMQTPLQPIVDLAPGEGRVMDINGKKVAVYKSEDGTSVKLSAVCTHLHCIVGWNAAEKTWDCPCHGSRYSKEGTVLNGPATQNLPSAE